MHIKKWVQILDVIIEKGKCPIFGKLRIIKLIEEDLQLLMRIYINVRI